MIRDVLSIGLPLLVILGGILLNRMDVKELRAEMNRRFDAIDARVERMEARFEKRFDAMDSRFDKRFDSAVSRFDKRFDTVDAELRYFHGETGKHEARLDLIEKR